VSNPVAIVGAGPAGLMAAETLAREGVPVTVYDRMAAPGRKFLMAGRGGLNLTHSEDLRTFLSRYGAAAPRLSAAIEAFPPAAVRAWCEGLGQETFVGSSGRVFPRAFKASPLLRAWLRRLDASGVRFARSHRWVGWDDDGALLFETLDGPKRVQADTTIMALGGASWPRLGSDGGWAEPIARAGIAVAPLQPANCGFTVDWSPIFRERFEGQPLKGVTLSFGAQTIRGEAVVTRNGLEGGGIYALSALLRDAIAATGRATLRIALRPGVSAAELQTALGTPRGKQSLSNVLRKTLKLSPVGIGLLHESALASQEKLTTMTAPALAERINAVAIGLVAPQPIATAISTAGGVALDELDDRYMLRGRPGVFAAGEMLDWEAPTGGYLLQACFATGVAAARGALEWRAANAGP
jgi:uncharacterized flavoprotein (TIGR03862 family)